MAESLTGTGIQIGLVKTSLIDYPGEVAAALFIRGCNLRCPYCHNPELVGGPGAGQRDFAPGDFLSPEEVLDFLHRRRRVLGGVCISGGEPLLHRDLPDFLREIRLLGFKIKIDTNGSLPEVLQAIPADYIAMDLKTVPEKYGLLMGPNPAILGRTAAGVAQIAGASHSAGDLHADGPSPADKAEEDLAQAIRESAAYLIQGGGDYEFRTTAAPGIFEPQDIPPMAEILQGARRHFIAPYRGDLTLDPQYGEKTIPYGDEELRAFGREFRKRGIRTKLRGI